MYYIVLVLTIETRLGIWLCGLQRGSGALLFEIGNYPVNGRTGKII